jgi:hypothetical protein
MATITKINTVQQSKIIIPIKVLDHCKKEQIPYWLCRHTFSTDVNGKVTKSLVKSTAPPTGWQEMSYQRLMACVNQHKIKNPTTIFINLKGQPWVILDCDDPDKSKDFVDANYNSDNYSLSISKNLPHKWLRKDPNDLNTTSHIGYKKEEGLKIDMLYQQVFERIDGVIHNYNESTLETFKDYRKKSILPTNTIATNLEKKDRIFDPTILDIINREYFGKDGVGDYADWRNICFSCFYCWGLDDGRDIALKYSCHSDYSEAETTNAIDNMVKNYDDAKSPKFGTLCKYAKESNQVLYTTWRMERYTPSLPENFRDLALKLLISEFKDKIVTCNNSTYLKKQHQPIFVSGTDKVNRHLYKHICNNTEMYKWSFRNPITGEKTIKEVDNVKHTNEVIKYITSNAVENDEFLNDIINENKGRVWFADGYFDFNTEEWVPTTNERTGIFIDRPMCSKSNPKIRAEIKEKILLKLFNNREDLANYYLYTLRLALECKISIKKFYEITGKRDCGKSILIKVLQICFGQYVAVLSIGNFYIKKGDTESRDLGFLLETPFARILILNENMPKKVLNGSIIKSLCSGGDTMKVRALYKEETTISPQSTLFMFANHQLAVEPLDTNEKRVSITLHNKFVEPGTEKVYSNVNYYDCDHTIDDYIKQSDVINEFTLMILTAKPCKYPEDLLEDEECDVEDSIDTKLKADFVYSEKSILKHSAIKKYLKESNLGIKPKELRHLLIGLFKGVEEHKDKNYNYKVYNIACIADEGVDEV